MSVTLAQLAKMTPEEQQRRLRGIDEPTRLKLLVSAAQVLASISNEGLRSSQK